MAGTGVINVYRHVCRYVCKHVCVDMFFRHTWQALEIVDAKTMKRVARVAMPNRIPAGFHALWTPAA